MTTRQPMLIIYLHNERDRDEVRALVAEQNYVVSGERASEGMVLVREGNLPRLSEYMTSMGYATELKR